MLSLAFLVVVLFSKYFGIFKSIHSVRRPTWGEIFFAIAVGATTYVTQNKWIFMAAILQMALADGLAAVVGVQYGRGQRYLVFGHTKSLVGSTTFMLISGMILASFAIVSATPLSFAVIFGLSVAAGIIENLGVLGLDNLFVPLLIAAVLEQIVH